MLCAGSSSTKEPRKPGEAKVDPEEKVRSPDPGAQHGARHPRGVIAAKMAEVLRACVIANCGRCRRPFGWGCNQKRREIAEANPRSPEMHAW